MAQQQDITAFQSQFNGPFPFSSDGVLIGTPDAGFEEEMQTMITFAGGAIDLGHPLPREHAPVVGRQRHRGQLQPDLLQGGHGHPGRVPVRAARTATAAGPAGRPRRSRPAWSSSSTTNYARDGSFWAGGPSNPTAYTLFDGSSTYDRPGTAYIALRQILGPARFDQALQQIQRQLRRRRHHRAAARGRPSPAGCPNHSEDCQDKLGQFFTQWFDTAYPTAAERPSRRITGPGLAGGGFYDSDGDCDGDWRRVSPRPSGRPGGRGTSPGRPARVRVPAGPDGRIVRTA